MVDAISRRRLLGSAGAAGGALLGAACGRSGRQISKLPATARAADVALLDGLLDVEHLVATAYTAAIPLLTHHNRRAAVRFLDQETMHIRDLEKLVRAAGGQTPVPKPRYDLGRPRGERQLLELLRRVEDRAISVYLGTIPKLSVGPARQLAVSILAVEAQHTSILRRNLGLVPVPSALVAGAE